MSPPSPYTPRLVSTRAPHLLKRKSYTSVVITRRESLPLSSQDNNVLCLAVGRKQLCRQLRSKVWALDLQPLMEPVGQALYHIQLLVCRLLLSSYFVEGSSDHPDCLTDIGLKPHPVKQPGEGVKHLLQTFRFSSRNQAILRVKEGDTVKHLLNPPICFFRTSQHQ